jgi:hypothetical protein
MGITPDSDTPHSDSSRFTGGGTAERAARERRPLHFLDAPAPRPTALTTFTLDRAGAREVIAELWRLCPDEPSSWRLDRFGLDLAGSLENLATVVFSPHRGLVVGPPIEVRVYPVADSHAQPLLVCVAPGDGPMMCRGIEDLTRALPDPWGAGPDKVLDALQILLDFAAAILEPARSRGAGVRSSNRWDPTAAAAGAVGSAQPIG